MKYNSLQKIKLMFRTRFVKNELQNLKENYKKKQVFMLLKLSQVFIIHLNLNSEYNIVLKIFLAKIMMFFKDCHTLKFKKK